MKESYPPAQRWIRVSFDIIVQCGLTFEKEMNLIWMRIVMEKNWSDAWLIMIQVVGNGRTKFCRHVLQ